jgi:hypothetical protein
MGCDDHAGATVHATPAGAEREARVVDAAVGIRTTTRAAECSGCSGHYARTELAR